MCYPVIVVGQLIDNNQEQNVKQILTINNEQQILSYDQQTEKTPVVLSTTQRYQGSPDKVGNSKTSRRPNTMQWK
jgi:hypothetical protein